jgi:ABC-type uncharacterized transport system permease subunit
VRDPVVIAVLAATVRNAVPLVFAVLGGICSERSGIINIALEGMLLASAFMAVVGSYFTHSAWVGLLVGVATGVVVGAMLGVLTIIFDADQIIAGFGINIAMVGATGFLMKAIFHVSGNTPQAPSFENYKVPGLGSIPVLGRVLFQQPAPGYLLFVALPLVWWFLFRTPLGLRLRASGENPAAVDTAGVSVVKMRFIGVMLSGLLTGIGGVYISLGLLDQFIQGMTVGRGFIALAIVILAAWDPIKGFLAALAFGFAQALTFQVGQTAVPQEFIDLLPYVLAVVVLAGVGRRAVAPAAEGRPYRPE